MIRLLDINVLLALVWPQNIHHRTVNEWVANQAERPLRIATSPITQLGFIRISMNVRDYATDFESARSLLLDLVNSNRFDHSFWPDDFSLLTEPFRKDLGPNQLADQYLVTLAAKRANGRLTTLDRGIQGPNVELITR